MAEPEIYSFSVRINANVCVPIQFKVNCSKCFTKVAQLIKLKLFTADSTDEEMYNKICQKEGCETLGKITMALGQIQNERLIVFQCSNLQPFDIVFDCNMDQNSKEFNVNIFTHGCPSVDTLEDFGLRQIKGESKLHKDFFLKKYLGGGSAADVFLCINKLDRQTYAIKRYVDEHDGFCMELAALSRLVHPNIVRYYQAWVENYVATGLTPEKSESSEDDVTRSIEGKAETEDVTPRLFLQMENCKMSLFDYISSYVYDEYWGIRSLREISSGLACIHANGLIHGDFDLGHPWVQVNGVAPDKPLDSAVLTRLKQFSAMNKLKKIAIRVIAESLSEEEIAGLKEMFKMIDTDNSGHITFEELKAGMERVGSKLKESEIYALMQAADVDNSGTIDYGEFLAATLHLNKIEREDHLYAAFSYFDKDGSGYITHDELQQACEEFGMGDVELDEIIREVDQDNVDIYSLGILFAVLLCDTRGSDAFIHIIVRPTSEIKKGKLPSFISEFPELEVMVRRMINDDPEIRPTAQDVSDILETIEASFSVREIHPWPANVTAEITDEEVSLIASETSGLFP